MASSNPALELASTLQTASVNRTPSPTHDINPSTSASKKIPVTVSDASLSQYTYDTSDAGDHELEDALEDGIEVDEEDGIPEDIVRPVPRRRSFGPLPDLRFEQSYLRSIEGCESSWGVMGVTLRDQVLLPLLQGTIWSLLLFGWRHWNRASQLSGQSVGAKVRRWWYKTNNWKLPTSVGLGRKMGNEKLAREMGDFYQNRSEFD